MKFNTALALLSASSLALADISLREAAGDFEFGFAGNTLYFNDEGYMNAAKNTFNAMVAENGCKFSGIQAQKDVFDFTDCDAHYEKAQELGMKFRGHCLIWHSYQPQWFQNVTGYENMKNTIVKHITTVLNHYHGKIDTWDVVNEAIDDQSTGEDGTFTLRDTFLSRECPDFIDIAFKTAREVDPTVKLFYNDYDNEGIESRTGKTNSVYNLVKDMVERGVPIDGVGLQYHQHTNIYPKYENVMKTMAKYAALGLEVQITEMDVNSIEGKTKEAFDFQAELYSDGLRACLDSSNCTAFLIWGLDDAHSWRNTGYPLIFNGGDYTPKPAYYALLNVFKEYHQDGSDSEESEADVGKETGAVEDVKEDSAEESN